jgi:hypothetical protein
MLTMLTILTIHYTTHHTLYSLYTTTQGASERDSNIGGAGAGGGAAQSNGLTLMDGKIQKLVI